MSTAAQPDAAPPAKPKKLLLIVVIVLGVVIGGGGGAFVAAPLLAGKPPAAAADSGAHGEEATASEEGGHGEEGSAPVLHLVENMVLNPANSNGSRFLLLSVGLSVKDAAAAKSLADRDAEVRDVVLGIMGTRTIEELTDIARRDSLKAEIRTAVRERFGDGAAREVYFPQFVIQ
jgi:flagellar FliL protein